jgi:hypothetical protein
VLHHRRPPEEATEEKERRDGALSDFAVNAMDFLRSGRAPFNVKFSMDDAVFKAHKLVVAAWSDWFEVVIYGHGDGNKRAETTWVKDRADGGASNIMIIKIPLYSYTTSKYTTIFIKNSIKYSETLDLTILFCSYGSIRHYKNH